MARLFYRLSNRGSEPGSCGRRVDGGCSTVVSFAGVRREDQQLLHKRISYSIQTGRNLKLDISPISNFICRRSRNFAFAAAKFRQNLLLIKPEKSFLLLADLVNVDV